jgi:hypothetical protein
MKTFFFSCRDGEQGSIENVDIINALFMVVNLFNKDVIEIKEMKEE